MLKLLIVAAIVAAVSAASHPTLSTMWISTTNEPQVGVGIESYLFVDNPTPQNPSTMWSNYTGCQRLLYADGTVSGSNRYLLGCDAVDCCYEQQDGNQVEYQIPNVHPEVLAPVSSLGKQTITVFGANVTCDAWHWSFFLENVTVYTLGSGSDVRTVRWAASAAGQIYNLDFASDYKNIPESQRAQFAATFAIPQVCQGNILQCDDARKKGLLKAPRMVTMGDRIAMLFKKMSGALHKF